ncbi:MULTISPECIES: helix-turn-helix domain-containing protein [Micromonospora]|uniref:XRE family transcriptional regulator n=1 Tax=Micromonospora solifontis TaxID=2487138 RepID=A0ABX9WJK8_9ACTN|nr:MULTISPECIES: helix-turn-helix transcriptional regulator [Micromonospora]NES15664.1 helix-turn-helix transcriptional regulator [Micromonospora sp. PPF5-17B]NES35964.1 helix-turn-helix transcriptional regulator [Micromonospora solifontis]NES56963.1 helix-turn-helix transcriptional regulator [Micromonospora sp. PPF5-6]RNM00072.1 XRE family transcriptional regulator [Micromonospora solifontis]
MANGKDLPDVGGFIRDLRRNAKISLRQLAEQAGVSNPYLSQIERGLRKPSAEVLQQLASALRVSTPAMYLRAGLLDDKEGQGVLAAIAVDPELTMAQKQSLTQIYETFRRENARLAEATAAAQAATEPTSAEVAEPRSAPEAPATATPAATGPTTPDGTPTEAVLESVAVTEAGATPTPTTAVPEKKAARRAVRKAAGAAEEEKS